MSIVPVFDAIHANISHLPANRQVAGYVTGSPDIVWTDADWKSHPGAIRIDQSPTASVWDATADVDDFENGAVALNELAARTKLRFDSFNKSIRPGQREPMIYMSASNVSAVVNALVNGGIHTGVHLWVANWNLTDAQAIADVANAAGPFPIGAVQYSNGPFFDYDVFSSSWLNNQSHKIIGTGPIVSGEVHLPHYADNGVYYNSNIGTLGYHGTDNVWHRVQLPRGN